MKRSELDRFAAAGRGVAVAWRYEPHLRFHSAAVALVSCVAGAAGLSEGEWLWLLVAMALVVVAETANAAVERAVDLAGQVNGLARDAKDMAAGAVLLAAVHAVVGGAYVFLWRRGPLVLLAALAAWPGQTAWAWGAYAAAMAVVLAALLGGAGRVVRRQVGPPT